MTSQWPGTQSWSSTTWLYRECLNIWGHLITTDTFLRLYTSAENESRVAAQLQVCQNKRKESHVWPILPGNPRGCTTIMLKGRVDAIASTGRKPYIFQHQTATLNRTRLPTCCWPVFRNKSSCLAIKVSFHSRSQGSQASQQACVCDAYWYGNMVGTHSSKFGEGLRYSQSSRTCSTFANTHEIQEGLLRGMETKNAGSQCSFVLEVQFWCYSYGRASKVWHAQSRNPLEMIVVPTFPAFATSEVCSGDSCDLNGNPSIAVAKIRRGLQPHIAEKLASLAICYGN